MSKYYKAEDVIRKRAENLADTSYWEYGNPKNVDEWIEVAEMEFKDLPTIEVSEDCISREWVKGICEYMLDEEMLGHMLGHIEDAPSVVPSRADGEWVDRDGWKFCSECNNRADEQANGVAIEPLCTNYCCECGAKMKGAEA